MLDALWAALPPSIVDVLPELWVALGETLVMMAVGLTAAVLIGGPLGIWLFLLSPGQSMQNRVLFAVVGWLVNRAWDLAQGTPLGPMVFSSVFPLSGITAVTKRSSRTPGPFHLVRTQ